MCFTDDHYIGPYPYHIPSNNEVIGLGYHAKSGLMLTSVGRLRPGVPSTLNAFCVAHYEKGNSPHLWGFPNYEKNTLNASFYGEFSFDIRKLPTEDRKYSAGYYNHFFVGLNQTDPKGKNYKDIRKLEEFSIINTYRPIIDNHCNRLFIIDTGVLRYGPSLIYDVQDPAIVVFDLPSNGCDRREFPLIRRVEIPKYLWNDPSGFSFITLDYSKRGSCEDLHLYIANLFDHSLTVYDYKRGSFWSFKDLSMRPILAESSLIFHPKIQYEVQLGITDVVLGWPDKADNRNAYYSPGSSTSEYVVSTKLLKNPRRAYRNNSDEFNLIGFRGCDTQNFHQTIDPSTGVIFFGQMQSKKILCWNTQRHFNPDTIGVIYESDALQFVSEINVDAEGYLWFHSSHLPLIYITDDKQLNINDINSRTFRVKASEAIEGTVCDVSDDFKPIH